MNKTVIIKQIGVIHSQNLPVLYPFKNKMRALIGDYDFKDFEIGQTIPERPDIIFGKNKKELKYEIPVVGEDEKLTEFQKKIISIVNDFWGNHPLILVNGKRHVNTPVHAVPIFDMVDEEVVLKESHRNFFDKLAAANMLVEINVEKRKDISYYYGVSPVGLKENELLLKLADFNTGICTLQANAFLQLWGSANEDRDILVIIKKAIEKGTINEKKESNRTDYFLGTTHLGTSINDVLAYCKREGKVYQNHIAREVGVSVTVKEAEVPMETTTNTVVSTSDSENERAFELLKVEAERLIEDGFMKKVPSSTKYEKLLERVKVGRENKEKELILP